MTYLIYFKKVVLVGILLIASVSYAQYCEPSMAASTTSFLNYFKISSTSAADGDLLNHASTNVGYENNPNTNVALASGSSLTFNFGVGDASKGANKRVHIWIDKNQDGDFLDPGEEIFNWTGANTSSDLLFSNKSIGAFSNSGATRMRIALRSANTSIPSINPCDNLTDGEIEDYGVVLSGTECSGSPSLSASTTSYLNYFKISSTMAAAGDLLNHASGNVGYENNTETNVSLVSGKSYTFNFGVGDPANGANKRVHVWIDKNQDGDFLDAEEEIFNWTGANTSSDLKFSNKSIGNIDKYGATTMRIVMRSSNGAISAIGPCDSFNDGEIEDYSITIAEPEPPLVELIPEVTTDLFSGDGIPFSSNGTPHTFRIPSLVTTTQGTVLAIGDARHEHAGDVPARIDITVRRSTDNGDSWGSPITINTQYGGDACTVVDKTTGRIFIFYAYSQYKNIFTSNGDPNSPNCLRSRYVYSDDDGITWSAPVDLTANLYKPGDNSYWASAGTGIQLRNGTLVIPIGVVRSGVIYGGIIYSTDHGDTWQRSQNNSFSSFDENTLVELNDGRIMVNARNHYGTGNRLITYTSDLGSTWESYTFDSKLIDPVCQGNIMRYTSTLDGYDQNRILFSNPASTSSRVDGALRISYDEGQTWTYSKLYQTGSSAYSCIAALPNGKIGVLYETDNYTNIRFKRFSLEDLTDNNDSTVSLSVDSFDKNNQSIKLYPNPVHSQLFLEGLQDVSGVAIYNLIGKCVYERKIGYNESKIDVSFLKRGIYIVKIKHQFGEEHIKILKE